MIEDIMKAKKKMLSSLLDVMDVQQMSDFLGISTKTGYTLLQEGAISKLISLHMQAMQKT